MVEARLRLGAPIFDDCGDPDTWIGALRRKGYTAAYCPLQAGVGDGLVRAYEKAAAEAGVVIAEVGAWSNPLSPNEDERRDALCKCQEQLALADSIGARCCVNIAGSLGQRWDGPHAADLLPAAFDLIVESVRAIIDAVKPSRSYYTLETMPWMYPDSADSYLRLIEAVSRARFAVHFDPVNLICSPQRYFDNRRVIQDFCRKLGSRIRSCHGKDVAMDTRFLTHLDEVRPGLGHLDYRILLQELARLEPDVPLMLEHLPGEEDYDLAAAYVRAAAHDAGISFC